MTYLLDANVLISLALQEHTFNKRVEQWIASLKIKDDTLASSPLTELAFIRVLTQLPDTEMSVADAKNLLARMKLLSRVSFVFIADDQGANHLPAWVQTAQQTTDGHLAELATAHGAVLATLDSKIPRSFVIPSIEKKNG